MTKIQAAKIEELKENFPPGTIPPDPIRLNDSVPGPVKRTLSPNGPRRKF
jgi:hypothetical protein